MAIFPPHVLPDYGAGEQDLWDDALLQSVTGIAQVASRRTVPRWQINVSFTRTPEISKEIEKFLRTTAKGSSGSFYMHTPSPWAWWDAVAIGTGDGSIRTFRARGRVVSGDVLTVASVAKTKGTHYEVGHENRAAYSEDFTQTGTWVAQGGATVTRTGGQTNPVGGATAYRLQSSGGSSTVKLLQTVNTPASGTAVKTSIWLKVNSSAAVTIDDGLGTSRTVVQSEGWVEVRLAGTGTGASRYIRFAVASAGYNLDCYVWHPLAIDGNAVEPTPRWEWGYVPTTAATIAYDSTYADQWVVFYGGSVPTTGQAVVLSAFMRRCLTGRIVRPADRGAPSYRQVTRTFVFEGEEVA